jgi:hypothetical protein
MTRLEKCELLKNKGYIYNPETGDIHSFKGKKLIHSNNGYKYIHIKNGIRLLQHHFAWYMVHGNVDFEELDHINRNRQDNRITNLRISNRTEQQCNRNAKGCYLYKRTGKWIARIQINKKNLHLGCFDNEEDAIKAYLIAKKKYHNL